MLVAIVQSNALTVLGFAAIMGANSNVHDETTLRITQYPSIPEIKEKIMLYVVSGIAVERYFWIHLN